MDWLIAVNVHTYTTDGFLEFGGQGGGRGSDILCVTLIKPWTQIQFIVSVQFQAVSGVPVCNQLCCKPPVFCCTGIEMKIAIKSFSQAFSSFSTNSVRENATSFRRLQ